MTNDFPHKWPGIAEACIANIKSNQPKRIYAGVAALTKIFKRFQYKSKKNRGPAHKLVQMAHPLLDMDDDTLRNILAYVEARGLAQRRVAKRVREPRPARETSRAGVEVARPVRRRWRRRRWRADA